MKRVLYIILVLAIFLFIGCRDKRDIYLYGTDEYKNKTKDFLISQEEAAEIIIKYIQAKVGPSQVIYRPGENHYILVDDYYVFSRLTKRGISLSGYYVNGYTDKVEEVNLLDDVFFEGKASKNQCYRYKK